MPTPTPMPILVAATRLLAETVVGGDVLLELDVAVVALPFVALAGGDVEDDCPVAEDVTDSVSDTLLLVRLNQVDHAKSESLVPATSSSSLKTLPRVRSSSGSPSLPSVLTTQLNAEDPTGVAVARLVCVSRVAALVAWRITYSTQGGTECCQYPCQCRCRLSGRLRD